MKKGLRLHLVLLVDYARTWSGFTGLGPKLDEPNYLFTPV